MAEDAAAREPPPLPPGGHGLRKQAGLETPVCGLLSAEARELPTLCSRALAPDVRTPSRFCILEGLVGLSPQGLHPRGFAGTRDRAQASIRHSLPHSWKNPKLSVCAVWGHRSGLRCTGFCPHQPRAPLRRMRSLPRLTCHLTFLPPLLSFPLSELGLFKL